MNKTFPKANRGPSKNKMIPKNKKNAPKETKPAPISKNEEREEGVEVSQ